MRPGRPSLLRRSTRGECTARSFRRRCRAAGGARRLGIGRGEGHTCARRTSRCTRTSATPRRDHRRDIRRLRQASVDNMCRAARSSIVRRCTSSGESAPRDRPAARARSGTRSRTRAARIRTGPLLRGAARRARTNRRRASTVRAVDRWAEGKRRAARPSRRAATIARAKRDCERSRPRAYNGVERCAARLPFARIRAERRVFFERLGEQRRSLGLCAM
jgi:hypothetical protein